MTNTYEVLLQRENGLNKTVYVHDCMYEDEAELEAQKYGLPVLRVLYKGATSSWNSDRLPPGNSPVPQSLGMNFRNIPNVFGLLLVGSSILIVVEFWLPMLLIGLCGGVSYGIVKHVNGKDKVTFKED